MTQESPPAFYLGSAEFTGDFARPRACWPQCLLGGPDSREYLWVRVAPAVIGQAFGLGGRDLEDLVLSPRHLGSSLAITGEQPVAVHIYIVRNEGILKSHSFGARDVEMVAWGEIYRSQSDAAAAQAG
jgi:hypothetical protein